MSAWLLEHRHEAGECGVAFAAWRGFPSPLRHQSAIATCRQGGHEVWWQVEADDEGAALAQLPPYVAARTHAVRITEVSIP